MTNIMYLDKFKYLSFMVEKYGGRICSNPIFIIKELHNTYNTVETISSVTSDVYKMGYNTVRNRYLGRCIIFSALLENYFTKVCDDLTKTLTQEYNPLVNYRFNLRVL